MFRQLLENYVALQNISSIYLPAFQGTDIHTKRIAIKSNIFKKVLSTSAATPATTTTTTTYETNSHPDTTNSTASSVGTNRSSNATCGS